MIRIVKNVPMKKFLEESKQLLKDHWEEIAKNKDKIALAPDEEKAYLMEANGFLLNAVAYDEDKMIGYTLIVITPHFHYKNDKFAHVDLLFLDKEYRKGKVGLQLIKISEELAKENGASILTHHAKPDTALEKLLPRLDYKLAEIIYSKMLKD